MASVAARIDPPSRQRILREMGIEALRRKASGQSGGRTACLILAPAAARGNESRERLLQRIVTASGLPESCCKLLWLQPGTGTATLPAHACCLVFGAELAGLGGDSAWQLPPLQQLLEQPAEKRQVWKALGEVRRRISVEE